MVVYIRVSILRSRVKTFKRDRHVYAMKLLRLRRVFSAHVPLLRTILGDLAFSHGYDVYLNDNTVHRRNTLSSSNVSINFYKSVLKDFCLFFFFFTILNHVSHQRNPFYTNSLSFWESYILRYVKNIISIYNSVKLQRLQVQKVQYKKYRRQ